MVASCATFRGMSTSLKDTLHAKGITLASVAAAIGVDKATMTRWAQTKVPAERVLEFEQITGVTRHDVRPDLWPREPVEAAQ